MSYNSNIADNIASTEGGKFVRIENDTRFPPISVVRTYATTPSTSGVDIYSKYGVLTYQVNANETSFADGMQVDQSGRLRVSMPGQQWWYVSAVDKDGDLRMIESFVAPATSIFIQNFAATLMTSGSASTGSATRMSR